MLYTNYSSSTSGLPINTVQEVFAEISHLSVYLHNKCTRIRDTSKEAPFSMQNGDVETVYLLKGLFEVYETSYRLRYVITSFISACEPSGFLENINNTLRDCIQSLEDIDYSYAPDIALGDSRTHITAQRPYLNTLLGAWMPYIQPLWNENHYITKGNIQDILLFVINSIKIIIEELIAPNYRSKESQQTPVPTLPCSSVLPRGIIKETNIEICSKAGVDRGLAEKVFAYHDDDENSKTIYKSAEKTSGRSVIPLKINGIEINIAPAVEFLANAEAQGKTTTKGREETFNTAFGKLAEDRRQKMDNLWDKSRKKDGCSKCAKAIKDRLNH